MLIQIAVLGYVFLGDNITVQERGRSGVRAIGDTAGFCIALSVVSLGISFFRLYSPSSKQPIRSIVW